MSAKKTIMKQRSVLFLASIFLSGGSPFAYAQQASVNAQQPTIEPSDKVEEIVVTAQRRAEAIKDVPISITALSAVTLENFGVQGFTDYAKLVPNLSFGYGGETGTFSGGVAQARNVTIRGISGAYTTSFYIDDTPLPLSLDPRVLDIDHIEVLRGPQGTLFGASSMGGTVRVITKASRGNELYGSVDAQTFGVSKGEGAGYSVSGNVQVPMVEDALSGRFSAFDSFTPGFFTRTSNDPTALNVTGQPVAGPAKVYSGIAAVRDSGVSGTLTITPPAIEGLKIVPMVMWQRTYSNGLPLADYTADNLVQRRILDQPEAYKDEFFFTSLTASYVLPFGRLVSSTSYFARESYDQEDGSDGNSQGFETPVVLPGTGRSTTYNKTFTQEGRFESDFDGPLQMVAGVFYQHTQALFVQLINSPGLDAATGGEFGTDEVYSPHSAVSTSQVAGFIGATYNITDDLQAQVGGRESYLTNKLTYRAGGIYGTYGDSLSTTAAGYAFTPRFSLKYNLTPDTMVYATAAKGFRTGGANASLPDFCSGYGFPLGQEIPYNSDSLWSYEAGTKTSVLDGKLSVNAAVYHINWEGIQQTRYLASGNCFAAVVENSGTATSDGGELEVSGKIIPGLTAHASAGYEDAKLTASSLSAYRVGQPLSGVPKWTASASLDYTIKTEWGDMFARGEYSFTGKSVSYSESSEGLLRKAYGLADIRLGADIKPFTFTFFVKNIFDTRANLGDESPQTAIAYGENGGRYRYIVSQPRTTGLEMRFDF